MPTPTDTMDGEDEIDDEEDRPRFCSLDPPHEVTCKARGIKTFVEFSEACRRGQVRQCRRQAVGCRLVDPNIVCDVRVRQVSNTFPNFVMQHSLFP